MDNCAQALNAVKSETDASTNVATLTAFIEFRSHLIFSTLG
jgi:hypothetical protein